MHIVSHQLRASVLSTQAHSCSAQTRGWRSTWIPATNTCGLEHWSLAVPSLVPSTNLRARPNPVAYSHTDPRIPNARGSVQPLSQSRLTLSLNPCSQLVLGSVASFHSSLANLSLFGILGIFLSFWPFWSFFYFIFLFKSILGQELVNLSRITY